MVKRISISLPDFVYNEYLDKVGNKSAFISEMIIKGFDTDINDANTFKAKIRELSQKISELLTENRRYKLKLSKFRGEKEKIENRKSKAFIKTIQNSGLLDRGFERR